MTANGARPTVLCSRLLWLSLGSWWLPERFRRLPKQDMDTLSSPASPILSRVEADPWIGESPEKREGELERICSLADRDQEGRMQFSLTAKGLVTEDLDDKLWRCTLLTNGRVEKPPAQQRKFCQTKSSKLLSNTLRHWRQSKGKPGGMTGPWPSMLVCLLESRITVCFQPFKDQFPYPQNRVMLSLKSAKCSPSTSSYIRVSMLSGKTLSVC